jgi:hypothetical protein
MFECQYKIRAKLHENGDLFQGSKQMGVRVLTDSDAPDERAILEARDRMLGLYRALADEGLHAGEIVSGMLTVIAMVDCDLRVRDIQSPLPSALRQTADLMEFGAFHARATSAGEA